MTSYQYEWNRKAILLGGFGQNKGQLELGAKPDSNWPQYFSINRWMAVLVQP
jgi:hypothetical protein